METRIVRGQVRAADISASQMRVSGMAALYNNPTLIGRGAGKGRFKEVLLPGAFRKAVASKQDTAFLINHDMNRLLGRVSSGTLRLKDTAEGLQFECDFPDTEEARSAYASIKRGDMHECSFGFDTEPGDDEWAIDKEARTAVRSIRNVSRLSDVSAVTFPAYSGTMVKAMRMENISYVSLPEEFVDADAPDDDDSVEAIARRRQLLNTALL